MGALTGLAAAGPGLYGLARGEQDVDRFNDESAGRKTDQAIRTQRLKEDQQTAPLRQKAAELAVDTNRFALDRAQAEAPQRDATLKYQFDTAKLAADDAKRVSDERDKAMKRRSTLEKGLIAHHVTGDPQHLADAIGEAYPDEIGKFEAKKDPATGNITIKGDKFAPHTFEPQTDGTGKALTSDQMFQKFGMMALDPVGTHVAQMNNEFAIDKEANKQQAIGDRQETNARIKAESALAVANARAEAEKGKQTDLEVTRGQRHLMGLLKTTQIPGNFQNSYSSEDDAKLAPHMGAALGKMIREGGAKYEQAAPQAIDQVRMGFAGQKKIALDSASKLIAAGVAPTDPEALAAAVKAGNPDAKALVASLGQTTKLFGKDIGKYLLDQLPAPKK